MRRALIICALALLSLMAATLLAGWWLLATETGQRWLLAELSRRTAVTITADQVEGRLLDHLRLTGATIRWPQGEARLAAVELRWQPTALLHGHLTVDTLTISGGTLIWSATDDREPDSGRPFWPRVEGWPLWLSATLDHLQLEDLALQGPAAMRHLDRLSAQLRWRRGTLAVEALEGAAEGYRLHGTARAGFRRPQLRLALQLDLPAPLASADRLTLNADLTPATGQILAGPFALRGRRGSDPAWQASGELAATPETISVHALSLTSHDRHGTAGGTASVTFAGEQPRWSARVTVADLDLEPELGMTTALGGKLSANGRGTTCQGDFELANPGTGWQALRLAGTFTADASGIDLPQLTGAWLHGTLAGALHLAWGDDLQLTGTLTGHALDPGAVAAGWSGQLNVEVSGALSRADNAPLRVRLHGRLLDSTLRGHPLTGLVDATLRGDDLQLKALELHGDGFAVHGQGRLAERLGWRAEIGALSGLLPAARGELSARGWLSRQDGRWAGALDGYGRQLGYEQLTIGALKLTARLTQDGATDARLDATSLAYDDWQLRETAVHLSGQRHAHTLELTARWASGELALTATGGWQDGAWSGILKRLEGKDIEAGPWRLLEPAELAVAPQQVRLAPLHLGGRGGESVRVQGDLSRDPWQGGGELHWQTLDLSRLNRWLPVILTGESGGSARLRLRPDGGLDLTGTVAAAGELRFGDQVLSLRRASGRLQWDAAGLRAALDAALDGAARLTARLDAPQPGGLALPAQGRFAADWSGFDLKHVRPWLPPGVALDGAWQGAASGEWREDRQLAVKGATTLDRGTLQWKTPEGEVSASLRTARLDWQWGGDSLRGSAALDLTDYGNLQGSFRLPLPAHLPAALEPAGPLHVDLTGQAAERGLLSAFFPGLVDNSRGTLKARAQTRGTWQQPELSGTIRLSGAGAYFPAAGIELKDVSLLGELAGDELRVTTFQASSGPGRVDGSGSLKLSNWRPASYQGTVRGAHFEAVNFPELRLLVSPDLTVSGDRKRLQLRGTLTVPELAVRDRRQQEVIHESPDVVLAGAEPAARREFPLALDLRIRLLLGERVLVKMAGVDARLTGELALQATSPEVVTANGEIQVAQGIYATYGVQLKIERGRLIYTGETVGQPTLDILALRRVGEVKAGVQIGGTPRSPQVKLYAEPAMPDSDILSYIVFGHPLRSGSGEFSLLSAAAGALLSHSQSVMLQDQIKQQLGIDVIEVAGGETLGGSMITIGKYLSPKLFLSFGQALFADASETRLRYSITPRWELETKTTGETSGVDLYYKIEFD